MSSNDGKPVLVLIRVNGRDVMGEQGAQEAAIIEEASSKLNIRLRLLIWGPNEAGAAMHSGEDVLLLIIHSVPPGQTTHLVPQEWLDGIRRCASTAQKRILAACPARLRVVGIVAPEVMEALDAAIYTAESLFHQLLPTPSPALRFPIFAAIREWRDSLLYPALPEQQSLPSDESMTQPSIRRSKGHVNPLTASSSEGCNLASLLTKVQEVQISSIPIALGPALHDSTNLSQEERELPSPDCCRLLVSASATGGASSVKVCEVDAAFERMFDYGAQEIVGQPLTTLSGEGTNEETVASLTRWLVNRPPQGKTGTASGSSKRDSNGAKEEPSRREQEAMYPINLYTHSGVPIACEIVCKDLSNPFAESRNGNSEATIYSMLAISRISMRRYCAQADMFAKAHPMGLWLRGLAGSKAAREDKDT